MRCHVCGAEMERVRTDLPFKTTLTTIVVFKYLPVWQCTNCQEYLIEDDVMKQVDETLAQVSDAAELEVVRFAA